MIIWLSFVVCIAGLLVYSKAVDAKTSEIGKIMFWVGLLVFLLQDPGLLTLLKR